MNDLDIAATGNSPCVQASVPEGRVWMRGDSYPENSFDFFAPIIEWIEAFLASRRPLALELELVYLNTSSVRAMMDVFDLLEEAHRDGVAVSVTWCYEAANERVGELAEEFREDCTFPFVVVSKS